MQTAVALLTIPSTPAFRQPEETSDAELILQIGDGNKEAMRVLWARHYLAVYRFILRLTNDSSVAEDTVNEVFLNVWRHAKSFQGKSQVSTWLLAIARNKAYSSLDRHPTQDLEDAAAVQDPSDDPEHATQTIDRSRVIRNCLKGLSPLHREIIDLVYYQEKSVAEVAQVIGISINTVKTRMFYARNRLHALLRDAGVTGV